jgi:hypothetical protein
LTRGVEFSAIHHATSGSCSGNFTLNNAGTSRQHRGRPPLALATKEEVAKAREAKDARVEKLAMKTQYSWISNHRHLKNDPTIARKAAKAILDSIETRLPQFHDFV